ncbi:hypothetical protein D777_03156 [Marinobacter nitratireducens]|uniref:Uncharacterized protein n=1 Tax=Marinobacter nitratireducens TaxID=1137280 RepID=A0A072NAA0_9GAMM|nr:hypothetical protein D777_03156 [Marinobacter nitratireducens]
MSFFREKELAALRHLCSLQKDTPAHRPLNIVRAVDFSNLKGMTEK